MKAKVRPSFFGFLVFAAVLSDCSGSNMRALIPTSNPLPQGPQFSYVANSGSRTVSGFSFNVMSGAPDFAGAEVATDDGGVREAAAPNGKLLYLQIGGTGSKRVGAARDGSWILYGG
jgi:hypothetical protein